MPSKGSKAHVELRGHVVWLSGYQSREAYEIAP